MATPKYQVGEIIYVDNINTTLSINKAKMCEVLGYRLDGSVTYLLYRKIGSEAEEMLPIIFEDNLTKSAGKNASLIYKKY